MERRLLTFKRYFLDFYGALNEGVQEKIDYALMLLKSQNRISAKFVKYIEDGIYELRAEYKKEIYRIFFIFDAGNIVVLFNGFKKQTKKTPRAEIEAAKRIKKEYYEEKK